MSTDKFPQLNESGMLDYLKRVYGYEIRKSVFDSVGCTEFYYRLLREEVIEIIRDEPDPLVKIGDSYQESDIYQKSLIKKGIILSD